MASTINSSTSNGIVITPDTSGEIELQANGVTKAKITSNGLQDANGNSITGGMYRNLIINGDMKIAQRGTSVAGITSTGYQTVDRWKPVIGTAGTWTNTQDTSVPSGQGFAYSTKWDCTTANASLSAGSLFALQQKFEGQMLQHIKKGTSSAESLTASFWVKSNKTGTLICELEDGDNGRTISKSYTIDTADTWEKKTITFAGDTSGALDNDNASSLNFNLWFVAGSNFTSGTLQTTWGVPTTADRVVGTMNLADSTSNYINITGVQLEVGDTATPFEHRPYDMELARCQRYYNRIYDIWCDSAVHVNGGRLMVRVDYPVQMRANPTVTTNTVSNTNCTFQSSNRTNTNGTHLYANATTATGDAFFVVNNMESNAEL